MKRTLSSLAMIAMAALMTNAFGQAGTGFTISDGDVFMTQADSPTTNTATAVNGAQFRVNGGAGTNHAFESWWWFRVNNDTREFNLANAAGTTSGGNSASTTWNMSGWDATLRYLVTDTGSESGHLLQEMVVTNTGSVPMVLNMFNYADFDMAGTFGGDNATLAGNTLTITDGTWQNAYTGVGANNYQVNEFALLRTQLTNATAENFSNTGAPFGPGDFTGGFQWIMTLDIGQSMNLTTTWQIQNVPEPSTIAVLVIGAGALLLRRRKA